MRFIALPTVMLSLRLSTATFAQGDAVTARTRSMHLDDTIWRLAAAVHVPIGLERTPGVGQKEGVAFTGDIEKDLDALVAQLDGYTWRKMNVVYVVRLSGAWSDATDVLNQRAPAVNWQRVDIREASDRIAALIYPNVKGRGTPSARQSRVDCRSHAERQRQSSRKAESSGIQKVVLADRCRKRPRAIAAVVSAWWSTRSGYTTKLTSGGANPGVFGLAPSA